MTIKTKDQVINDYLLALQDIDEKKTALCLILETFSPKHMTLKQIKANYMAITGQDIDMDELKMHLDSMVSEAYNNKIYSCNQRDQYNLLF